MLIKWSDNALIDLDIIVRYIFQHNPVAALEIEELILDSVQNLGTTPYIGRIGQVFGTRELVVHPNYMIVYCINDHMLEIAAIVHTKRHYPSP
ncbi:type II toxin-antitoxin system RelE/ParE family toxin [Snodgrassella sp. CFCC 13594]|uniref:type II toxin-antitoxin system RelE/ParE family toxin n=1 Tax=Snodgrassella sp. CFCC 13594 TaxID=1775559 RepID=UPI000830BECA|nr:type II toxin-antitoxin system RelE/ParE family toxin [Snodgrassella sp. CFCC 13594]